MSLRNVLDDALDAGVLWNGIERFDPITKPYVYDEVCVVGRTITISYKECLNTDEESVAFSGGVAGMDLKDDYDALAVADAVNAARNLPRHLSQRTHHHVSLVRSLAGPGYEVQLVVIPHFTPDDVERLYELCSAWRTDSEELREQRLT